MAIQEQLGQVEKALHNIDFTMKLDGVRPLFQRFGRTKKELENPRRMLRVIGERMVSEFNKQMLRGVDPDGRALKKVESWTRFYRKGLNQASGRMIPLNARGTLRRSIFYVVKDNTCFIKFRASQDDKAVRMFYGRQGQMPIKKKFIRENRGGEKYIQYLSDSGQWRTKSVTNGSVRIVPYARPFFYLSKKYDKIVTREANKYLTKKLFRLA